MKPQTTPDLSRLAIAIGLGLAAASPSALAINSVINDNFISGTAPWSLNLGSGGAASLDNNAGWGCVSITSGGTSRSTVNLEQTLGRPFINGATYTISFDVRADSTKPIDILLRNNTAIYSATYGYNATPAATRKTITYTHTLADAYDVKLSFRVGGNTIPVYIDNVVVTRAGQSSALITKTGPIPTPTTPWTFPTISVPINGTSPVAYKDFNAGAYDFSYAGYNYGEREDFVGIPANVYAVAVPAPDADGERDISQNLIDAVAAAAATGGTVQLPAGTFYIGKNRTGKVVTVSSDNTVIKGAGMGVTILNIHRTYHSLPLTSSLSSRTSEAFKSGVITFARGNGGSWYDGSTASNVATVPVGSATIPLNARSITVSDPSNTLATATTVVIRQIFSRQFNEDHAWQGGNTKRWRWSDYLEDASGNLILDTDGKGIPLFNDGSFSLSYFRKVLSQTVVGTTRTLNLDVPIPHELVPQEFADSDPNALPNPDHQKITVAKKSTALLTNCGLQDITFTAEDEDGVPAEDDTGCTVLATGVYNGLFKNIDVDSFRTQGLATAYPVNTSFINCTTANALNTGGGGSGYGFYIKGQNLLYKNCNAINVRHGYTTAASQTSNIVIKNCTSDSYRFRTGVTSGESVDDTHLQYAHGILWDNHYSNNAGLLMINREELSLQAWETCGWSIVWNYENEGNNALSSTNSDIRHNLLGNTPLEFGLVIGAHAGQGLGLVGAHDKTTRGIRVVDGYTRINGDSQQYDDWGVAITSATAQVGGVARRVMFEQTGQPVAESIYDIQFAQRTKLVP